MFRFGSVIPILLVGISICQAAEKEHVSFAARLFFQEHETRSLKWVDVQEGKNQQLFLGQMSDVSGFPKLDRAKQKLVQMKEIKGRLMVGVRDEEEGKFGSGWVLLLTEVKYADHGDHGHWKYKNKPKVLTSLLDKNQGNPAHLYVYDEQFYLANDLKAGYTWIDPETFSETIKGDPILGTPRFIPGGGNHITLAVVNKKVGYGSWIDGGGPNKGRVDVTPLTSSSGAIQYSFHLPTGVIHGATTCANKVFFAPTDGICWVEADLEAKRNKEQVQIHHISLGKEGDKPLRTGAFTTHDKHVLCITGKEAQAKLVLLNATEADPKPIFVSLNGKAGNKPLTPEVVTQKGKNPLAFVFHDHDKDTQTDDFLDVIALDPNNDGNYSDAKVIKTIKVGPSKVDGHYGHHDIGFDADGRTAYFTNPGNGTISVLDLKSLEVKQSFQVGGMPTALIVLGGRETED